MEGQNSGAHVITEDNTTTRPLKVFLWTYPRTVSTTMIKCMTYVPGTLAWFEPYMQIAKFSERVDDPVYSRDFRDFVEMHGGESEVAKIGSGFDASDKDFNWLKDELERDLPGTRLVFVKDMGYTIVSEGRYDKIPKGFRHTFLIRNPEKVMKSHINTFWKRRKAGASKEMALLRNVGLRSAKLRPIRDLNRLWKYVQAQGFESRPVIIDVDELLTNPKEMLEAYCNEVGIPFTDDLLTWPTGDDVMTKLWMVPKQTILTFRTVGMHDTTFASTGFHKRAVRGKEVDDPSKGMPMIVRMLLWAVAKWGAYKEGPYYEEMYAERLTSHSDVNSNVVPLKKKGSSDSILPLLALLSVPVCLLAVYYILAWW